MTLWHMLYQLLIGPLELLFEYLFAYARQFLGSVGLSVLALSLCMNFLLLPLYRRADAIQDEEREKQKQMADWVKRIKKTFSGNERFMMLQTYYRQNGYKPYYALRGMLPLLLEIPFFIAAYHFLSNLTELDGAVFGPIANLGLPDGLLRIGGINVNLLPILMTTVNLISGAIYTKGLPLKDKLQLYGMALIFLVLLYDSPAGLVVYWTMNNLFSLLKNLYAKLPGREKLRSAVLAVLAALLLGLALLSRSLTAGKRVFLLLAAAIAALPVLFAVRPSLRPRLPEGRPRYPLFLGGCGFLALLTGMLIPSAVVKASPPEFVYLTAYRDPLWHVVSASLLAVGFFVVWLGIFYYLSGRKVRWVLDRLVWIASGLALVNYMFFGTRLGTLTSELAYDAEPVFSGKMKLLNLAVLLLAAAVLTLVWKKKRGFVKYAYAVLCVAALGMSAVNAVRISRQLPAVRRAVQSAQTVADSGQSIRTTLSRTGKNVVVIMLDRAVSCFLPYLMQERPELQEQFAGFTYYPNTLSYGLATNFAAPALFGGYEYVPAEMNRRSDEPLADKHLEALQLMPTLFDENGYEVTVFDPVYAGYSWVPDVTTFSDLPDVRVYNTEQGQFNRARSEEQAGRMLRIWERDFFLYSLMKISPCAAQPALYQHGGYALSNRSQQAQSVSGTSMAVGVSNSFMNSYSVLEALPSVTDFTDAEQGCFFMMVNSTPHMPTLLQEPDYVPSGYVDNRAYDAAHADRFTLDGTTLPMDTAERMKHYQVNMAALLQVGAWLDSLRAAGVYDNTRIIIVSDHGWGLHFFDAWQLAEGRYDEIMWYNPLLLVKDFGSTAFTTDGRFMTNADVPTLAFEGVIENPVNPATGQPVTDEAKYAGSQFVIVSDFYDVTRNNGSTYAPARWYAFRGENVFDRDNWSDDGYR